MSIGSKSALIVCAGFLVFANAATSEAAKQRVPAKLICGPHSSNPARLPAFQSTMTFALADDQLLATRPIRANGSNGAGVETFKGTVSPTGAMLISGSGQRKTGGAWRYEFTGSRNDTGDTVVRGQLTNTNGAIGSRDCQIVFFKPRSL
jgi:hypothetical protein